MRNLKNTDVAAPDEDRGDERRRQIADQRLALTSLCRDLERQRDDRETRNLVLCHELGREPERFDSPSLTNRGDAGAAFGKFHWPAKGERDVEEQA